VVKNRSIFNVAWWPMPGSEDELDEEETLLIGRLLPTYNVRKK
jgi:hypothetical protein